MCQCAADVAHQAPGIHLPRRPHTLTKKEITGQRRQRADHKAIAPAQRRPCDNGNGAHRLKVGNGPKQDAPRRRQRRQHQRGHNLTQARTRCLIARKKQRKHERHHDQHGKRRLLDARHQRSSHHHRHRQQQRDLHMLQCTRQRQPPSDKCSYMVARAKKKPTSPPVGPNSYSSVTPAAQAAPSPIRPSP